MKRTVTGCLTLAALLCVSVTRADDTKPEPPKPEPPKAEQSVTQHSIAIGGKTVAYNATAGTMILRNPKDEPTAAMGYIAYTERGVTEPAKRPIVFAYNGGPGSSSLWLHMGALGPRRIVTTDAGPTPPAPYKVVDNGYSLLDKADLVMIDPVGTGLSHAVGKAQDKDFWGVDPDIDSISQFIVQYVTDNNRWGSPKYLLGESYGTTRSAGIVEHLQSKDGMDMNGVILISVALDLESIFNYPGNDRPYAFFLPTYAAVAAYHQALPKNPEKLEPFLDEVRRYAAGEYSAALFRGNALTDAERDAVAAKLHDYTGLSVAYLKRSNLRVDEDNFTQELLREQGKTVGRLDARFTGVSFDLLARGSAGFDPQAAAIGPAYTAAFMEYFHHDLKVPTARTYHTSSDSIGSSWNFTHNFAFLPPGAPSLTGNTTPDLAHAMGVNPNLRVLALNGYYDLATPFFATEFTMDHLDLQKDLRSHLQMKYYPAGHMMYVHEPALQQMKTDIGAFLDATSHS